jgi:DNA polymerase
MTDFSPEYVATTLKWYLDNGVDIALEEMPVDRMQDVPPQPQRQPAQSPNPQAVTPGQGMMPAVNADTARAAGTDALRAQAAALAKAADTLEELQAAIKAFDGLAIRKTAMNMVFSDGNPAANIMLIGEMPGADEDRSGKAFSGESGAYLDKILASVDLSRAPQDSQNGVYLTTLLNWRPPGNRSPAKAEIDISLPFLRRHIALIKPQILIACGGITAKALLNTAETLTKMRGKLHDYTCDSGAVIPLVTTYTPEYLLRNPGQKRAVWEDMQMLREKLTQILS